MSERDRVVHCRKEECDVFIDRGTRWGNPWTVSKFGHTREQAITLYEGYIRSSLECGRIKREDVLALRGKRLGCWCAPKACHGDVLLNIAEELYNESLLQS